MRRLRSALLVAVAAAQAGGCTAALKKDSSFVFGSTETGGEWLTHDCWNQRDAKDGGEPSELKR